MSEPKILGTLYRATTVSYFEKAVEMDPDYAMAWGCLANARALLILWRPFDEVSPVATAAYEKALALDPKQSEALAAKALMTLILEHDWEAAGKLYQKAIHYTPVIKPVSPTFYYGAEMRKRPS